MRISDWSSDVCSSDLLYRVFFNLAHNALEAGARELHLAARPVRDFLVIDVEDDGPGMPEEAQRNIFKPFAGSAREGGTGLGLDRKRVGEGKSVSERVNLGGWRISKKKKNDKRE